MIHTVLYKEFKTLLNLYIDLFKVPHSLAISKCNVDWYFSEIFEVLVIESVSAEFDAFISQLYCPVLEPDHDSVLCNMCLRKCTSGEQLKGQAY